MGNFPLAQGSKVVKIVKTLEAFSHFFINPSFTAIFGFMVVSHRDVNIDVYWNMIISRKKHYFQNVSPFPNFFLSFVVAEVPTTRIRRKIREEADECIMLHYWKRLVYNDIDIVVWYIAHTSSSNTVCFNFFLSKLNPFLHNFFGEAPNNILFSQKFQVR